MTVRVKIIGRDKLNGKLGRIAIEGVRGVSKAVAQSGLEIQTEARRLLQQGPPRTGVKVTRGGKEHTRSAPGEPPKTDTGRLASNIFAILDGDQMAVEVGTRLDYGIHLEFGTQDGKLAARPWLLPTYERLKPKIEKRIKNAMQKEAREEARR